MPNADKGIKGEVFVAIIKKPEPRVDSGSKKEEFRRLLDYHHFLDIGEIS